MTGLAGAHGRKYIVRRRGRLPAAGSGSATMTRASSGRRANSPGLGSCWTGSVVGLLGRSDGGMTAHAMA